MKFTLFLLMALSQVCLADGILTSQRTPSAFKLDSSSSNIPTGPDTSAGSKVLSGVGASQHLNVCSTATTAIRYSYSTKGVTPASGSAYDGIIPAAPTGGEVCATFDDIQLTSSLFLWSDGSAISTGIVKGQTW